MKSTRLQIVFLILLFAVTGLSHAGVANPDTTTNILVVPNSYATIPGNNLFTGPIGNTPRTYQLLIHEDQLTQFLGRDLKGIGFRLPTSATADWPLTNATYSSFDIYLSESVPPSQRSLTFIENIVGTQTLVRTGVLVIPSGSYRFGDVPNTFGPVIEFNNPWTYTGSHLLIEMRHTGHNATARSVDAIGTATGGYGTQFSACWGSNYTATSGPQGNFSVTAIIADDLVGIVGNSEIPFEYNLKQNFPNPFNPTTTIQFSIPKNEFVTLKVFNSLGQVVSQLVNANLTTGTYDFSFDASGLTSGVYYYELIAGDFKETKRMTLIK